MVRVNSRLHNIIPLSEDAISIKLKPKRPGCKETTLTESQCSPSIFKLDIRFSYSVKIYSLKYLNEIICLRVFPLPKAFNQRNEFYFQQRKEDIQQK